MKHYLSIFALLAATTASAWNNDTNWSGTIYPRESDFTNAVRFRIAPVDSTGSNRYATMAQVTDAVAGVSSPILTVAVHNAASTWDAEAKTLTVNTNDSGAAETDPIWAAASNAYMTGASAAGLSNLAAGAQTKTNRYTPATAVCSTGTIQFAPGADNLYTYLPTNPFTLQMAYGVTEVGTIRFEVQASTCTITWGASIKNAGRDSSTNLTMSTTTNMSFILDKRFGESKANIYQIGL